MSDEETTGPEFIAVALQVSCNGVNLISDVAEARARIADLVHTTPSILASSRAA